MGKKKVSPLRKRYNKLVTSVTKLRDRVRRKVNDTVCTIRHKIEDVQDFLNDHLVYTQVSLHVLRKPHLVRTDNSIRLGLGLATIYLENVGLTWYENKYYKYHHTLGSEKYLEKQGVKVNGNFVKRALMQYSRTRFPWVTSFTVGLLHHKFKVVSVTTGFMNLKVIEALSPRTLINNMRERVVKEGDNPVKIVIVPKDAKKKSNKLKKQLKKAKR